VRGRRLGLRRGAARAGFASSKVECRMSWPRLRADPLPDRADPLGAHLPHRVFGERQRCCAHWFAQDLHAVIARNSRSAATRLRGIHAAAQSHTICAGPCPLTGFGSPSGYYPCCTVDRLAIASRDQRCHQPHDPQQTIYCLPRFVPLQRFSVARSYLTPADSTHRFGCALRVSHPLDALFPARPCELVSSRFHSWGFPSRLCSTRSAVRSFKRRVPRGLAPHRV